MQHQYTASHRSAPSVALRPRRRGDGRIVEDDSNNRRLSPFPTVAWAPLEPATRFGRRGFAWNIVLYSFSSAYPYLHHERKEHGKYTWWKNRTFCTTASNSCLHVNTSLGTGSLCIFLPPCASSTSASLHSSVQRGCNGRARNTPFSLFRIKADIERTSKTGHRERASPPPAHALFAKWVEEFSSPNLDSRRVLSVRVTLCSHLLPPLSGLLVAAKT